MAHSSASVTMRRSNATHAKHSMAHEDVNITFLTPNECAAAARKRVHMLISGLRVDCRADQAPYSNPLTELVDWFELELGLMVRVHLKVELRSDIALSLAAPLLESFDRLRRRLGERRVQQWQISASPMLSTAQLLREHPHYKSMRPCSWPEVYNTLSAAWKIASLTRELLACPDDLVLRLRPNAAVDLRPSWPVVLSSLASGCEVLTPEQESNNGVNDNFAVLTVSGLSRYAAVYSRFEVLVQRRGCVHPESIVKENLRGRRHCALPVLFWPRACMGYAELAMAAASGHEDRALLRERIVGNAPLTWGTPPPPPPPKAAAANKHPASRITIPVVGK